MLRSLCLLLCCLFPTLALAAPEIGKPAPDFTGSAAEDAKVTLSQYKGKIVVLEWNNPECPFVHKHYDGGDMQKLQAYAKDKGVVWLAVNSGAPGRQGNMTPAEAKDHIAKNKLAVAHYLLDPEGAIGKLYGAKTTPHLFIIAADGNLAYQGAIDDQPAADPATLKGAHNYVRAALESLLAGKPVETASTQAYGCSVKYAE